MNDNPVDRGPYDPQTGEPLGEANTTPDYTPPPSPPPHPTAETEPMATAPYAPATQVNVTAKKSNTPLIVGLAALVVLVVLAAAAYFVFKKTAGREGVAAERVLPTNALGYFTVAANPPASQKAALDTMKEAFQSQPGFNDALAKITKQAAGLSEAAGLNTGNTAGATPEVNNLDTLSGYLSNITIAFLPPNSDDLQKLAAGKGDVSNSAIGEVFGKNVVGLVDIDFNPLNKKGPISELKNAVDNLNGKSEKVELYKEVQISKYVTGTNTVYFALLPDTATAAAGARIEPVRAAIDGFKEGKGLKEDPTFKTLSGQVPADRVASLYINLTEIYRELKLAAPEETASVQNAQGAMLVTLSAQDDGVQLDVASQADFSSNALGVSSAGVSINPAAMPDASTLTDIPTGSLGFIAGADLKSVALATLEQLRKQKSDSGGNMAEEMEKSVKESTGLDIKNDILAWMGGDFALSGAPEGDGGYLTFQLKLKGEDRDKAASTLDKATAKMMEGRSQFEAAGGTFFAESEGSGTAAGVTKDRLIAMFESDTEKAKARIEEVQNGVGKGFGSTDAWRAAVKHLPKESNLIGYLDLAGARALAEKDLSGSSKEEYDSTAAPFLKPFKYLVVGSASHAPKDGGLSSNHTQIFLGISK